jgi:hypothetical protein
VVAALVTASAIVLAGSSGLGSRAGADATSTVHLAPELRLAKAATARFRSVGEARAAGYAGPREGRRACVESTSGGMGVHFASPTLMKSPILDVRRPEMLVYEKTGAGELRLVALEYFKSDADQDVHTQGDRPTLFGRAFDGPMPGHRRGMGVHYELHVWLWKHNPRGLFSAWNPHVRCRS